MKIVYHEDYLKLTQTPGHPECPERLAAIMGYIEEHDLRPTIITPEPANLDDITPIHSEGYLELLKHFGRGRLDMDTAVWPYTYEMAMLAAGGGIAAAGNMLDHGEPTFAMLRPPGHHATGEMGMGFCYINNIAVAANWLLKRLERVAIVDMDVHHGNGTNDTFRDRPDVLYISTHQWGIFPGTGPAEDVGAGEGRGYNVNIPLNSRSGDATYAAAMDKIVLPVLRQYRPDAILISLGVDAHYMDPLASLNLSSTGYMRMFGQLADLSGEICGNRYGVFLEGGYNLGALAEVVGSSMALAGGQEYDMMFTEVSDRDNVGADFLKEAIDIHSKYWDL